MPLMSTLVHFALRRLKLDKRSRKVKLHYENTYKLISGGRDYAII